MRPRAALPIRRHPGPRRRSRHAETVTETETVTVTVTETETSTLTLTLALTETETSTLTVTETVTETEGEAQGQARRETTMSDAPIVGVSAVVFDETGRVLVVERGRPPSEGLWSVPGGRLEPDETMTEAVAREVREETGLEVEVGPLIEVLERASATCRYLIHPHVARVIGGTLAAGSDARRVRWVTDDELAALPTTEGLADVIAKARARGP